MKILEKRIKEIEEKELALKNRLKRIKMEKNSLHQKELNRKRKIDTRLKILAGAVVLRDTPKESLVTLANKMTEKDKKWFLENINRG